MVERRRSASLQVERGPRLQMMVQIGSVGVTGAAGDELRKMEQRKIVAVGERKAIRGNLPAEAVQHDVPVEYREVLRLRLECIDARPMYRRRPDGVHPDVGADIDEDITRLEAGYPFDRVRLLDEEGVDAPFGGDI